MADANTTATNPAELTHAVARLNDATRHGTLKNARIVMTRAVAEILSGDSEHHEARAANQILNMSRLCRHIVDTPIEPGNDPYGERDFGAVDFMGHRMLWKIDCYANDGQFCRGSDAPWSEDASFRIMTIMLASEY